MTDRVNRRQLVKMLAAWPALAVLPQSGCAVPEPAPTMRRFGFEQLRRQAKALAQRPYAAPQVRYGKLLDRIDYDTYQKIRFRSDYTLWREKPSAFPVEFFHLGRYARHPVEIHAVETGEARRIRYTPAHFDTERTGLENIPDDLGFAGFRVMGRGGETDWLAFQGASYFRSAGELEQYGLSARGVAINTALPGESEEFPRFSRFWLEPLPEDENALRIYALLEGESLTGAYRFDCRNDGEIAMDVRAELFLRRDIERLGIAPLTSMYWYSETNHRQAADWRPEIHDSDGLALWLGNGERLWRPLNNPPQVQTTSYVHERLRGFGLLQRDRAFDHYQDDGVFYDRRPSVWVEPLNDWGAGHVQLVELPTDDEIHDNIVAYWVPKKPARAGDSLRLDYRLFWNGEEPYPSDSLARVRATRIGRSGVPGQHEPRDPNGRKFAIDFEGGALSGMEQRYDLDVVVETSRGRIAKPYALKVVGTERWRAIFDLHADGGQPVDVRCQVKLGDRVLTETWLYHYQPDAWGMPA